MGDVVNVRVTFGWLRWFKSTLTNYKGYTREHAAILKFVHTTITVVMAFPIIPSHIM